MIVQSSDRIAGVAASAFRENRYAFLVGAFPILCPGEKPVRAPYVEAMCYALQKVETGRCLRLMV